MLYIFLPTGIKIVCFLSSSDESPPRPALNCVCGHRPFGHTHQLLLNPHTLNHPSIPPSIRIHQICTEIAIAVKYVQFHIKNKSPVQQKYFDCLAHRTPSVTPPPSTTHTPKLTATRKYPRTSRFTEQRHSARGHPKSVDLPTGRAGKGAC
mgnify:CR=1 FL=1